MNYAGIVPDYDTYLKLQAGKYQSFESDVSRWRDPQQEVLRKWLAPLDRRTRILDCACGDGAGLAVMRDLGFDNVIGVELSQEKADRAEQYGYRIHRQDAHGLNFPIGVFDLIYSSHTMEHLYRPLDVLDNFYRMLRPEGDFWLILPYPDDGVVEAHGGKFDLRTQYEDHLIGLSTVLQDHGFRILSQERGYRDGPEVQIQARRIG